MKVYKISLKTLKGELVVLTITASNFYEAMKKVDIAPGWHFVDYSVIGGTA